MVDTSLLTNCLTRTPGNQRVSTVNLMERARAQVPVPAPLVKTAPPRDKKILVQMPTWFWLDESQAGTRTATARADGAWSRVEASAQTLVINPGDGGESFTCESPGIAYTDRVHADEDAACTYTYRRSGSFTVQVTASWGASWEGSDGNGGTLPSIDRSARFRVRVVEARSELIDGA